MRFSVWNTANRNYDYFDAPGANSAHAGAPPRASTSELGATPEQAAWPLPVAAVKVGSGEMPQGRIASFGDGASGIDLQKSVLYGMIGYLIWRVLR
jgi:hypothetical protein